MGEEEKKPPAEEKKPEEGKKAAEEKKEEVEKAQGKPANDEEKKPAAEESKEGKDAKGDESAQPPPPPQEIVLKVFMHCEGCARKVRRCLRGFEGVEEVITDCKTHKVVVKGEKADPLKVLGRVQRKSHRQVELLSPIPKPPALEDEKKAEEKEPPKPEEKKEEPQVVAVVLKVHMHCEACSLEIKKRILRMKGVNTAEPDLKSSEVTVKGVFDPPKLVDYVYKRTGKHAVIVKQEPENKKDDGVGAAAKEEKKEEGGESKAAAGEGEKKEGDHNEEKAATAAAAAAAAAAAGGEAEAGMEETKVVEVKKNVNEYHYYPPRYAMEMYAYPPQIFSDENPNACSVM